MDGRQGQGGRVMTMVGGGVSSTVKSWVLAYPEVGVREVVS